MPLLSSLDLSLTKAYVADPEISSQKKGVNLRSDRFLRYKDPQIAAEFRRFLFRDVAMLFVGVLYWSGCYLYGFFVPIGKWAPVNYVAGFFIFLCFVLDTGLHVSRPNTRQLAHIRSVIQLVMGLSCIPPTAFVAYHSFHFVCKDSTAAILARPRTVSDILVSCQSIHQPFAFILPTCTFVLFALSPLQMALLFVTYIAAAIITRPSMNIHVSNVETFSMLLVGTTAGLLAYFLILLRYKNAMRHFEQAVNAAIETANAKRREEEIDELMCNMVPPTVLARIVAYEPISDSADSATVLFADMVSFTAWSKNRTPREIAAMLNLLCVEFDSSAVKFGVEKIKTIGDAYWAVSGIPCPVPESAERVCDFGNNMLATIDRLNSKHIEWDEVSFRVGVNTGPLGGAVFGKQQVTYEVFGRASEIAEEVEKTAPPSLVTVSLSTLNALELPTDLRGISANQVLIFDESTVTYCLMRQSIRKHRMYLQADDDERMEIASNISLRSCSPPLIDMKEESKRRRQDYIHGRHRKSNLSLQLKQRDEEPQEESSNSSDLLAPSTPSHYSFEVSSPSAAGTTTSAEDILAVPARKYKHLFYDFADQQLEAKYRRFSTNTQLPTRKLSRVATLLFLIVLLCSIFPQVSPGDFPLPSVGLYLLALLCSTMDTALSFHKSDMSNAYPQVFLHHVVSVLAILAAAPMRGLSVTTNNATYLHGVFALFVGAGNVGIVSSGTLALTQICIIIPVVYIVIFPDVMLVTEQLFVGQSLILIILMVITMEKQSRRHFLDRRTAAYFEWIQVQRNLEQETVLMTMVPMHVIQPLKKWMAKGMPIEETIAIRYPKACVAFLKIEPLFSEPTPKGRTSPSPTSESLEETDTAEAILLIDAVVCGRSGAYSHLFATHQAIDTVLEGFDAIAKIKTIGNVVMIAGPFSRRSSVGEAADQILAAIVAIANQVKKVAKVNAGIHVGEVVGAVLGLNRICFDVFGDVVNVASRAQGVAENGQIVVTDDFWMEFTNSEWTHRYSTRARFSDPLKLQARNRGLISVRRVKYVGVELSSVGEPLQETSTGEFESSVNSDLTSTGSSTVPVIQRPTNLNRNFDEEVILES